MIKGIAKVAGACVMVLLAYEACTLIVPTYVFNYRLTLDVDVDGTVRRGSGVVSVAYRLVPDNITRGLGQEEVHGEVSGYAITVDLGARGLLFVVNATPLLVSHNSMLFNPSFSLGSLPLVVYGLPAYGSATFMKPVLEALQRRRGSVDVPFDDLPMIVHFRSFNQIGPAFEVNPNDPEQSFGKGAHLRRAFLELTQDAVTPVPENWPSWLKKGKNLIFPLLTDDKSLSIPPTVQMTTYPFKGE